MNDKIERFKTMFLDECDEHVRTLERTLSAMRSGARSQELVDDAFRAIHSVKGGAGMFAFDRIVPFAHIFETALERVRVGQIEVSNEFITVALRATDCLSDLILAIGNNTDLAPGYESNAQSALTRLVGLPEHDIYQIHSTTREEKPTASGLTERFEIRFHPHAHLFKRANEPLFIVRQLQGLGTLKVTIDQSKLPSFSDLQPLDAYLGWHFELETDKGETAIRDIFQFVEGDCDLTIQLQPAEVAAVFSFDELITATPADHRPSQNESAVSTIRVEVSRIDRLVNLAGEIAISEALVAQQIDQSLSNVNPRLFQELSQLLIHTQNLQDSVMAIRAQPISTIFDRMPRLVRELSEQTNKKIIMRTAGENTEIDKTVIEQLSDPIMHMIRNAADHGIESTEERVAAGKPVDGLIHLSAEQRGSRIVIEISDDGCGINREKVRQKAIAKNLIAADAVLSNEDIDHLVFLPGFSTAEKVTNLSGRGVGMDVVKRNIQKLGGRVSLRSEPGRGSTVILTLPLTLAVLEGMIVRSGVESYVIPISNIIECRTSWQKDAGAVPGFGEVLNVRGGYLCLVHLSSVFNTTTTSGQDHSVAIIAEIEGGGQIALVVDEIIGQQQVVIKNITDNLDPVPGIAGATILGDGRVALILDATEIAKLSASDGKKNNLLDIQHRRQVA
jgi:two-component system, chemotaxis family, sensor kinase CheA